MPSARCAQHSRITSPPHTPRAACRCPTSARMLASGYCGISYVPESSRLAHSEGLRCRLTPMRRGGRAPPAADAQSPGP